MATIKDVAKRAGVSISTVSNVMNGSKYVSDELKKRVADAISELNYRVDVTARNEEYQGNRRYCHRDQYHLYAAGDERDSEFRIQAWLPDPVLFL